MDSNRSRGATLIGVAAAAGAFGVAAMVSAATAPTARADDFTDIITAIDGDLISGQTDFTAAFTDFSSNVPEGLNAFYSGLDEDLWAAPTNLELGTVEALLGEPITGSLGVDVGLPVDFSSAVTEAPTEISAGEAEFTAGATALASGDYATAVEDDAVGSLLVFDVSGQLLLIGGAEALGL
jgi:hypothetical protein